MTEAGRIRLAKLVDESVGRLSTRALPHSRFSDRSARGTKTVKKILFIKFWGIGSIVLTEPALRWLGKAYPAAEIHYLTFSRNDRLVGLIPGVARVHTLPFHSFRSFAAGCCRSLPRLRKESFDLILDAEFFSYFSGLLSYFAAPSARIIGFTHPRSHKKLLQSVSVPFRPDRHVASQFLTLAQAGWRGIRRVSTPGQRPFLGRRPSDLPGEGRPDGCRERYAVLNVNASPLAVERRWPRRRFIRLARSLLSRHDFDLVLTGSRNERPYVAAVEAELKDPARVRNLCGLTDTPQLVSLLRDAVLVISNDSGPVHVASAFNVPVVAFYGPETPELYGPLSSRRLVFYEKLWCSPCMSVENAKTVNCINDGACMREIDVARVIDAVHRFIEVEVQCAPHVCFGEATGLFARPDLNPIYQNPPGR